MTVNFLRQNVCQLHTLDVLRLRCDKAFKLFFQLCLNFVIDYGLDELCERRKFTVLLALSVLDLGD